MEMATAFFLDSCQAQNPTPLPTKGHRITQMSQLWLWFMQLRSGPAKGRTPCSSSEIWGSGSIP